jgi:hypothetical protein
MCFLGVLSHNGLKNRFFREKNRGPIFPAIHGHQILHKTYDMSFVFFIKKILGLTPSCVPL